MSESKVRISNPPSAAASRGFGPRPTSRASETGIRAELERILSSAAFASATRHQKLLRHVVEKSLTGDADALKEYAIGRVVLERSEDFDPSADSVVRTQASLLRKRLADYDTHEGANSPIHLKLPRGG